MTQEDKELLLKDLSARLLYEVQVMVKGFGNDFATCIDFSCEGEEQLTVLYNGYTDDIENFVPYLRPMLSMTEEEAMEYANCGNIIANSPQNNYLIPNPNCVDWLNAHHFDYRGLIEKGLALEAPEGMYNFNLSEVI